MCDLPTEGRKVPKNPPTSLVFFTVKKVQCTTVKRRFARILLLKQHFIKIKKIIIIIMTPKTIYDQRLFSKDNISGYY